MSTTTQMFMAFRWRWCASPCLACSPGGDVDCEGVHHHCCHSPSLHFVVESSATVHVKNCELFAAHAPNFRRKLLMAVMLRVMTHTRMSGMHGRLSVAFARFHTFWGGGAPLCFLPMMGHANNLICYRHCCE